MTHLVTTPSMEERLDRLSSQVEQIAAELSIQGESRERWQELAQTLMPLSHSAFDLASRELEDLSVDVTADDAVRFARTAARSLPQLELLLAALAHPETVGLFNRAMATLREGQSAYVDAPSTLGLLRALRDPQTRRGLARALSLLQTLGAGPTSNVVSNATPTHIGRGD